MPSGFRSPSRLHLVAGSPRRLSGAIAGSAHTGSVRLSPRVLRRVLVTVHALRCWHLRVGLASGISSGPAPLPTARTALTLPSVDARVLDGVRMSARAVGDGLHRVLRSERGVSDSRTISLARPAESLAVCVAARVGVGVLVPAGAVGLSTVPAGSPASRRVLGVGLEAYVGRIHARPVRTFISACAVIRLVALVISHKTIRYLADEVSVRNQVRENGLAVPAELSVAEALSCGPAPAAVGVDAHLVPEALGQSGVAVSRRGGTFGHVRLLRSRTVPRECSNTRRGPSCHFTEFPSYRSEEFLVHSGAESHRPGMHLANSASKQGENP